MIVADRFDRRRNAREPIDHRDQDVTDATPLELGHHALPERSTLCLCDPEAQDVLRATCGDSERQIHRLVMHEALIANLHAERIEGHPDLHRLQRPLLPRLHFLQHIVGDVGDQIRQHWDGVIFLQVRLQLAHTEPARVEREHFLIKLRESPHALWHEQLGEAAVAITRNFAALGAYRFRRRPVARAGNLVLVRSRPKYPC